MSDVNRFNGIKITVEGSNTSYHSYDDWGLYVTNTDCIGTPVLATSYIEVPGRNGLIDMSEAISGRPTYKSRPISIKLAGARYRTDWDSVISAFRNSINGRIVHITFDNDVAYYWRGRVEITDFVSVMSLGTFTVSLPYADPYKYDIESTSEPWHWDPFNFITGVIRESDVHEITGSGTVTIPSGGMYVVPEIVVSNMTSSTFTVTCNGKTFTLRSGTNRIPSILVNGDEEVNLNFVGTANVQIVFRGGSL